MIQNSPTLLDRMMALEDPRQAAKCTHDLGEVVFMATCGLLCGADDWNAIALFAEVREEWFRQYLKLPGGIPSHDTFNRLFSLLDPAQFRELFTRWVQDVLIDTPLSGVVAIDGKTVRGSRSGNQGAIHMVNAWSTELGVSLGQYKVDKKSNEIKAIPELLDILMLRGCLVTLDAMGCQKKGRLPTKFSRLKRTTCWRSSAINASSMLRRIPGSIVTGPSTRMMCPVSRLQRFTVTRMGVRSCGAAGCYMIWRAVRLPHPETPARSQPSSWIVAVPEHRPA